MTRPRIYYRDWRGRWRYYDDIRDAPRTLGLRGKEWIKLAVLSALMAL